MNDVFVVQVFGGAASSIVLPPAPPHPPSPPSPPPPTGLIELARNRTTAQSSLYIKYNNDTTRTSDKAVDDVINQNGDYFQPNLPTCAHTFKDWEPWWYVDLGATQLVVAINIFWRTDCCVQRHRCAYLSFLFCCLPELRCQYHA